MYIKGVKKNDYRPKKGHYSANFYSTYMMHLSLEAEFYQVYRSYFKILVRLVILEKY